MLEDPFRDFEGSTLELYVAKFFHFIRSNWKEFTMVASLVVVLLVCFVAYSVWADVQEEQGVVAFEKLVKEPIFRPGSGAEDAALRKLEQYSSEHATNSAHFRSSLYRLKLLLAQEKSEDALDVAKSLAGEMDTPELGAYFHLQTGILLENAGSYAEAAEAYGKVRESIFNDNVVKALALFGEGRCLLEMGRDRDGKDAIRRMMDMSAVNDIDNLRITAAAYLLSKASE